MYYLCTFFDHSLFTLRLIEHWCYNTIRILHLRPADPSQHDPIICKKQPLRMFFKISFFFMMKAFTNTVNGDAVLNIYLQQIHLKRPKIARSSSEVDWDPKAFVDDAPWCLDIPWFGMYEVFQVKVLLGKTTKKKLHPGNWTWPLKIGLPNRKVVFQPPFFWAMLYNFWGCTGGSSSCTECCCWPGGNYQHVSCVVDVDLTT